MKSERWATREEIKRVLVPGGQHGQGGSVLFHENGRNWVFPGESHEIYLGMSGTGKTRRGTIPMSKSFIQSGESFIVVDPKGEIYQHTGAEAAGTHEVHVVDFRHIRKSEGWDPLQVPKEDFASGDPARMEIAIELIDELAHALYAVTPRDPFWSDSGRSLFIGAVYALMMCAKPEQVNLTSVFQLISRGNERFGIGTYLKEFVSMLPADSVAAIELFSYATTAEETRGGIRSTFLQGITKFLRSEGRRSLLSSNDLRINELDGVTPTAIYIILPDESPIYTPIAGVLCSQLMRHYIRIAQDQYNGKLPCRLNVCLEELASIGRAMPNLPHLMAASRSRNIRCQLVLQSLSQLDTLYGESDATTIKANADVLVAFRTNHWETLVELSKKCGERKVECNNHVSYEPLITPTQLAAMENGQALVVISGRTKFITRLPDFTQMFDCSAWQPPQSIPCKREPLAEPFDIQAYVKENKRKHMLKYHPYMPQPPFPMPSPEWASVLEEIDKMDTGTSDEEDLDLTGVFDDDEPLSLLDDEEETDEQPDISPKEENKRTVMLISMGSSKGDVIKTVRKHTHKGLRQVKEALDNLPATFYFDTKKEAKDFLDALNAAGAVAVSNSFLFDD